MAGDAGREPSDWDRLLYTGGGAARAACRAAVGGTVGLSSRRGRRCPSPYDVYASGITVLAAMLGRTRGTRRRGADRREILAGRGERLPELLPDVIYGLLMPFLDQQETLRGAARPGRYRTAFPIGNAVSSARMTRAGRPQRLPELASEILFSLLVPFLGPEAAAVEMERAKDLEVARAAERSR